MLLLANVITKTTFFPLIKNTFGKKKYKYIYIYIYVAVSKYKWPAKVGFPKILFFGHGKTLIRFKLGATSQGNLVKTWWPWGAGMFATSLGPHDACPFEKSLW